MAFCKAPTLLVGENPVVMPLWHRQIQECLQQAVDVACREEVLSPCDEGNALNGIIQCDRKMIAGSDVFAREDDVTEHLRFGRLASLHEIDPGQGTGQFNGFIHIEAKGKGLACLRSLPAFGLWHASTCPGIVGPVGSVRRGGRFCDFRLDVAPCAETGIEKASVLQVLEGCAIGIKAGGLAHGLPGPREAQPLKILKDGVFEFASATPHINILNTQKEFSAAG